MKFFKDNYYRINELASQRRRRWNINENDAIDIFSLALNKLDNLTIAFIKMNNELSGACYCTEGQKIIFINSAHSKGRQAFTLAHEIYHLEEEKTNFSICSVKNNDDEVEKTADLYASCLLMSHSALETFKLNNDIDKWTLDNVIKTEQYFQLSHHAMLWRIRNLDYINFDTYIIFKDSVKYNASIRGYDLRLYEPFSDKENLVIGNYINLTEKAFKDDLISIGKKEELLLDAYREDIVYAFDDDEEIY